MVLREWRRKLVALGLVGALAGCRFFDDGEGCTRGEGLDAAAFGGGELADKTLALSLAGGPTEATGEIDDYLFSNGIQAAFFVEGEAAVANEGALEALKAHGHLVGNHGYSGAALDAVEDPVVEVLRTDALIAAHVTGEMFLLRAPSGAFGADIAERLNRGGARKYVGPVGWDIGEPKADFTPDEDCWAAGTLPAACANGYLIEIRRAKKGVVRLKGDASETLEMLRVIVPKLKDEGFTFVRLDAAPSVKTKILKAGGSPGTVGGAGGCAGY